MVKANLVANVPPELEMRALSLSCFNVTADISPVSYVQDYRKGIGS